MTELGVKKCSQFLLRVSKLKSVSPAVETKSSLGNQETLGFEKIRRGKYLW